jgi:hypothetical protein
VAISVDCDGVYWSFVTKDLVLALEKRTCDLIAIYFLVFCFEILLYRNRTLSHPVVKHKNSREGTQGVEKSKFFII